MKYVFLWNIENFSYCWHRNGEKLVSPVFVTEKLENTTWNMYLYPRGKDDIDVGGMCICLCRNNDEGPEKVKISLHLSIVSTTGQSNSSKSTSRVYLKKIGHGWSYKELYKDIPQLKNEYLHNDILTIRLMVCENGDHHGKYSSIYARTRIGVERISYLHEVSGDQTLFRNGSNTIHIPGPSNESFIQSNVDYKFVGSGYKRYIDMEIKPSDSKLILTECKISSVDSHGNVRIVADIDARFEPTWKEIKKISFCHSNVRLKRRHIDEAAISLICDCTFSKGIEFNRLEIKYEEIPKTSVKMTQSYPLVMESINKKISAASSLVDHIKNTYAIATDLVFKTNTNTYPVHKFVLFARSPVFRNMFENEMREKKTDTIQVDDLDDDSVKCLVAFLYSDCVDNLDWETAIQLYYAADKYMIEKLKWMCSSFLVENISTSTAFDLLNLAFIHSDDMLSMVAKEFILKNGQEIFPSQNWKELMEKNPSLAAEIVNPINA